jgi:hypothetical protein
VFEAARRQKIKPLGAGIDLLPHAVRELSELSQLSRLADSPCGKRRRTTSAGIRFQSA